MKHVAVIGAGVAGLAAAKMLLRRGLYVTVYEKSRVVGGRVTTRLVNGCRFDQGAQVIKTPSTRLLQLVTTGIVDGLSGAYNLSRPVWTFDEAGSIREGNPAQNADTKWSWGNGAMSLSQAMASGVPIQHQAQVHSLKQTSEGYSLHDSERHLLGTASIVLLTPPAPQTAGIVMNSALDPILQEQLLAELTRCSYRRCISVALAYPRRPQVPWYALVNTDRKHPIAWLACEHDKAGHAPAEMGLLIAQMAHDFSVAHWDEVKKGTCGERGSALPAPIAQVCEYVQSLLPQDIGRPLWANVQRWRYALPNPETTCRFAELNNSQSGLYFAGDYIEGNGRVHQAIESGWQVAERIIAELNGRPAADND